MKKTNFFFMLLFLATSIQMLGQQPTKTNNSSDQWTIRWNCSDEFNADDVDWTKWIKTGNALPNTTGWKWDNTANVKIVDGIAELTMKEGFTAGTNGAEDNFFKSGILKSYVTQTYGYYEAKIKGALVDDGIGKGVCPAFWLYSNFDQGVAAGEVIYCEIDVVELQQFDWTPEFGNEDIKDMDCNLHCQIKGEANWRRPKKFPEAQMNKYRATWDPRDEFHIYGCEVNENEIIWFIDGVEIGRKPNEFWKRPMNITASLGLRTPFVEYRDNANHAVDPNANTTAGRAAKAALDGMPATMYVDYIRFWEKSASSISIPAVNSVSVSPTSGTIAIDEELYLNETILPNNASNTNVTWSTSNATVATVSTLGVITGKSAGNAIITVKTVDGNKTATCAITVTGVISSDGCAPEWEAKSYSRGDVVMNNGIEYEVKWAEVKAPCEPGSCNGWNTLGPCSASGTVTSIDIVTKADDVRVYPNPYGNGNLTIELANKDNVFIYISDIQGRIVFSNRYYEQSEIVIQASQLNLNKGVYIIQAQCDKYTSIQKIVVE